jgi:uncharacterized RDD family membrane protein YckC
MPLVCTACQKTGISDQDVYCPDCGQKALAAVAGATAATPAVVRPASLGQRVGAFAIDAFLIFFLTFLNLAPVLNLLGALVVLTYDLFRDVYGASIGKKMVGLQVFSQTGAAATPAQCILRNVILSLSNIALIVRALGAIASNSLDLMLYSVEFLVLAMTGSRLGDRIAGTTVLRVKR